MCRQNSPRPSTKKRTSSSAWVCSLRKRRRREVLSDGSVSPAEHQRWRVRPVMTRFTSALKACRTVARSAPCGTELRKGQRSKPIPRPCSSSCGWSGDRRSPVQARRMLNQHPVDGLKDVEATHRRLRNTGSLAIIDPQNWGTLTLVGASPEIPICSPWRRYAPSNRPI